MERMVAYCGLVCTACPCYVATQANDMAALEQVAVKTREMLQKPELTAQDMMCDGCLSVGRKIGYCAQCEIRACASAKGVANCAHCADYACDKLTGFFDMAAEAKTTLDEIRRALSA